MRIRRTMPSFVARLASPASSASTSSTNVVRDLAGRVGPTGGAPLACRDIEGSPLPVRFQAPARFQAIVGRFHMLIGHAAKVLDRNTAGGGNMLTAGKMACIATERWLGERSSNDPGAVSLSGIIGRETLFGIVLPFSGTRKKTGRERHGPEADRRRRDKCQQSLRQNVIMTELEFSSPRPRGAFAMSFRLSMFFVGALLASEANAAGSSTEVVRDLAGRVGPIIGSAQVCRDIERSRVQVIVDKF